MSVLWDIFCALPAWLRVAVCAAVWFAIAELIALVCSAGTRSDLIYLDQERERVRRALATAPSSRDYGNGRSLRSVPTLATRFPPRANDERAYGTVQRPGPRGSTTGVSSMASRRAGPARPFRPGTVR